MKTKCVLHLLTGCCLCLIPLLNPLTPAAQKQKDKSAKPKTREFLFTYQATITDLKPGQKARIWLPIPPNTEHQKAKVAFTKFPRGAMVKKTTGAKFRNHYYYIEATANKDGKIPLQATYRIRREEVRGDAKTKNAGGKIEKLFLRTNRNIPIGGKPAEKLLKNKTLSKNEFELGKQLFDIVNHHMKYNKPKGEPWGRGDAIWACDSRFGNCTDFHSLFISLARTKKMPAKFEIGFSLPEKRGKGEIPGYHCWAWFKPNGHGWLPVDISAAQLQPDKAAYFFGNLTENRVLFSTGRDLELAPRQKGPPVNFFIYPYVEVNGQPYPLEKMYRRFLYQDVNS